MEPLESFSGTETLRRAADATDRHRQWRDSWAGWEAMPEAGMAGGEGWNELHGEYGGGYEENHHPREFGNLDDEWYPELSDPSHPLNFTDRGWV